MSQSERDLLLIGGALAVGVKHSGRDWGATGSISCRKIDKAQFSFSVWCLMTR